MKAAPPTWRVRIEMPPDLGLVGTARHMVNRLLAERGGGQRLQREFGLIVTELLNNAIENLRSGDRHPIELELRLLGNRAWLAVRGRSDPSGFRALRRALQSAELHSMDQERGRGLYLIKSLADSIGIKNLSGGRTEIWMTKSL